MAWRDWGWPDKESMLPGLILIAGAALILAWGRITTGLTVRGQPQERLLAAMGAVVLLACFLAGMNYSYRWIFALWPALWLWRRATDEQISTIQRWAARIACVLVWFCLWSDGIFCAIINIFIPYHSQAWEDHMKLVWRLWTQPEHWLLLMMLAGWLVEGVLATAKEWWGLRHEK